MLADDGAQELLVDRNERLEHVDDVDGVTIIEDRWRIAHLVHISMIHIIKHKSGNTYGNHSLVDRASDAPEAFCDLGSVEEDVLVGKSVKGCRQRLKEHTATLMLDTTVLRLLDI